MMNKHIIFIGILTMLFGIFGFKVVEQNQTPEILDACNSKEIRKRVKELLKPDYEYDSVKSTRITFKKKKQFKEIEVPLYLGEKYRFVFSKEGLPQDVDIEIFNKKFEAKKRSLLWASKNEDPDQQEYFFEPSKHGKIYIDYLIPETNDTIKKGCVMFALGFQIK